MDVFPQYNDKNGKFDDLYPEKKERQKIYGTIENQLIEMIILIRFKTNG